MKKISSYIITGILTASLLTACASATGNTASSQSVSAEQAVYSSGASTASLTTATSSTATDTSELFSKRDLNQTADTSEAVSIEVSDNKIYTISDEGVYVITGEAENCTIKIDADKEAKIQLVLDGVTVTNDNFPVIYVVSADKCFITTTDSENTMTVTGKFTSDGDTNTDAVIYSKDDLVLNGVGTLNVTSYYGNGITGKDDIKITGGTYNIKSALDSIEANDSIAIYDGTFNITTNKDGLHSENSDDDTVGYIYIKDGTFTINSASDAIQGTSYVQIDGGKLDITASEGIEGTYVIINGGTINISASDDGINASAKSSAYKIPTIEINGGELTIVVGQGDTDGIDANGNIYVNGGTINITAQMSSFDYDGTAEYNGGTIIINGSQVDSIPQSMMMGGPGGNGGFGGQMNGGKNGFGGRR